ncbi:MAG: ribonuclease Y [Rhodothermales bacterium]
MDSAVLLSLAAALVALGLGFVLGRLTWVGRAGRRLDEAAREAEALIEQAQQEAETFRQQHVVTARDALEAERHRLATEAQEQKSKFRRIRHKLDARQEKLARRLKRIGQREDAVQKALDAVDALRAEADHRNTEAEELRASVQKLAKAVGSRQQEVAARERDAEALRESLAAKHVRLDRLVGEHIRKLEAVTGISKQEALERLIEELENEAKLEAAAAIKEIRDEAKMTANREARKVVLTAIQRTASTHTIEHTVSVVQLTSDDMKGRIIGREGRNIRAFEAATGIEVVVDDTPEAVLLSGFDPVRREIAKVAMERLVQDGRIHPARIEEIVEKTRAEIEEDVIEAGEQAVIELGLHGLHPELVRLVGRMKFRFSYGQNLLAHSMEVAQLASLMAAELDLDPRKARRAGLLHDIGKVVEGELESPHAIVGMEWAQRYKEHPEVCNAVGAHHDEIEMTSALSPIVQAADSISGARPGARREGLENYVQRLKALEEVARGFDGVQRVYAIQAGREVRVIVNHDLVSDARADQMAREISKKIEHDLQYPGQVKITVIREVRAVAYAK